jgi:hypothetical protein
MPGHQLLAGFDDISFGQRDVHVFLLGLDQNAEELLAVLSVALFSGNSPLRRG